MSFFTTFITQAIGYFYGLIFAGCCAALFFIVYFFMIETKDRSLEEIDSMYLLYVNPITSAKWKAGELGSTGMRDVGADGLLLRKGGREVKKGDKQTGAGLMVLDETRFPENTASASQNV